MDTTTLRILRLLPAALVAGIYMSCGPVTESPYEDDYDNGVEMASDIVPMAPLIPWTDSIRLMSPSFSRTIPMSQTVSFAFGTTGYANGVLVVMRSRPQIAAGRVVNFRSDCVAGAASMAGQAFDGFLTAGPRSSDLFVCNGDATNPFSRDKRVKICPQDADTCLHNDLDYWWFVLGYDEQMRLTRSSPAFRFRLEY